MKIHHFKTAMPIERVAVFCCNKKPLGEPCGFITLIELLTHFELILYQSSFDDRLKFIIAYQVIIFFLQELPMSIPRE